MIPLLYFVWGSGSVDALVRPFVIGGVIYIMLSYGNIMCRNVHFVNNKSYVFPFINNKKPTGEGGLGILVVSWLGLDIEQ